MDRRTTKLAAGLAFLWLGGVGLFVYPAWNAVGRQKDLIRSARAEAGRVTDRPAELLRRGARLSDAAQFVKQHTKAIPTEGDVAGLVRSLSMYLDELGVRTREIATGTTTAAGAISTMPMSLNMECDFMDAVAVLSHVESQPRLIRVRRFKAARERAPEGGTNFTSPLRVELMLEVVWADAQADKNTKVASPEGGKP